MPLDSDNVVVQILGRRLESPNLHHQNDHQTDDEMEEIDVEEDERSELTTPD
jgi:hypothetical protein